MNLSSDIWSASFDDLRSVFTGEPERLTHDRSHKAFLTCSAGGSKLVFISDRTGNNDVWLMDVKARRQSPLTVTPENEWRSFISPDGSKVVYSRTRISGSDGNPKIGPEDRPFLAAKAVASASRRATLELLARLYPKRNSLSTAALNTCVSLSATLRVLNSASRGL